MEKVYKPIACGLYDQLEIWAMRRNDVTITYTSGSTTLNVTDRIKDLSQLNGAECLILESDGSSIRLDDLISVNGVTFEGAESCKIS